MKLKNIVFIIIVFLAPYCWSYDLIIMGDLRTGSGNEEYQVTESIIREAIDYATTNGDSYDDDIAGIILTGDYVSKGNNNQQWDNFTRAIAPAFFYPLYPCVGNHDRQPGILFYNQWNYYETFNVSLWYSADIGDVHIISLVADLVKNPFSPVSLFLESMQYTWLINDLEANKDKFTIVIWHDPAYGSHTEGGGGHGSNEFMRFRYVPVCEALGADIIICGHNHWYERTVPIAKGKADDTGIIHITTGGGGAPLSTVSTSLKDKVSAPDGTILSEVNISAYHFCVLSIDTDGLKRIDVIEHETQTILDSFILRER